MKERNIKFQSAPMWRRLFRVCWITLLVSGMGAANATVVKNNFDSGPDSLRDAISSTGPGGTITFAPNVRGMITLSNQLNIGRDLTIQGPGAKMLTISGNSQCRVFNVSTGMVVIEGLTIANGLASGGQGGGIYNSTGLSLFSCSLINNQAASSGCSVDNSGNDNGAAGGAIYNSSTAGLSLQWCTFASNTAVGPPADSCGHGAHAGNARGGAIYASGLGGNPDIEIFDCTFCYNQAIGGHAFDSGGDFQAAGSAWGGAIFRAPAADGNPTGIRIYYCTICSNACVSGIPPNTSGYETGCEDGGGGIFAGDQCYYDRSTLYVHPVSMADTIVAANAKGAVSASGTEDVEGYVLSLGFNLIGVIDGSSLWNPLDTQLGTAFSALNPRVGALADNGGPTPTMALRDGSAAIDQGAFVLGGYSKADQRFMPRPIDFPDIPNPPLGDGTDIGAYEANFTTQSYTVDTLGSSNNTGHFSLSTILGTTNLIQSTADLASGGWSNLPGSVAGSGGVTVVNVTNNTGARQQFYRAATTLHPASPLSVSFDSTMDLLYTNGWVGGQNGGKGLGPWALKISCSNCPAGNGFFIGSSTNNGTGAAPGIDAGEGSWGIHANSGNLAAAFRTFGNSLATGTTVRVDMDNGYIDASNSVGFVLRNGSASDSPTNYNTGARFQFLYSTFDSTNSYKVMDAGGTHNLGVPWRSTGLQLLFTLNTSNSYTLLMVDNAGGVTNSFSGTLAGLGSLESIAFFNNNAGFNPDHDTYFNSVQVVGP